MLVLLIGFLVISDMLLVIFIHLYFDILNDGLCLYPLCWCGAQCPLSVGSQRKLSVCVIVLFYYQTESLHNTAEVEGLRVGLIGTKRGFILVFTLCNRHNCVIKKTGFVFQHTCVLIYIVCLCFFSVMFCLDHRILFLGQRKKNNTAA